MSHLFDSRIVLQWGAAPIACVLAALLSIAADDAKPDVTITTVRAPGNVFGGQETEFEFRVASQKAIKGRVIWRLAAGTATVAAKETDMAAAPDTPGKIVLRLPIPPVKDGVVLSTRLTVSVLEAGQSKPVAVHEQDVWVFPKAPFFAQSEWLKNLKISLYDPRGATAKVFTAANIPFEEVRTVESVADLKAGVLIVGEGLSFKEERGLAATLDTIATAGVAVLCLAPADGELVLPGLSGPGRGQQDLIFRREIVREMDKRLDPDGWPPDGKTIASTVAAKPGEGGVVGEVTAAEAGWPWVEARYGPGKGRWAVCGLAVVAKWDAGPTPRFLFARLLEHVSGSKMDQPKKEGER